ncbi:MAG: glycosyltransferase family 39 protein [Methanosarcinaceae archaeon]|nr:glycosyltransferase family 39 protein [Methanosarcinaceae archaeon]
MGKSKNRRKNKSPSEKNIMVYVQDSQLQSPLITIYKKILADRFILILIAITLLGAYLRIHNLGTQSIWLDEGASYRYIQDTLMGTYRTAVSANEAPITFVLLHLMSYFGTSEFMLRFPSAISGILTIPVIYFVGSSLFGKEEGVISAFLLSISMMHLWYSQEARMYAHMTLFSLMSLYFFYQANKENTKKLWAYYVIATSLAFYSHYYTVFVIIPEVFYYLVSQIVVPSVNKRKLFISDPKNIRLFSISMVALFICILPFLTIFVKQALSRVSSAPTWGMQQSLNFIPSMLIQFSTQKSGTTSLIFILIFVIGLIAAALRQKEQFTFLGIFLVIPLTASYILAGSMPFSPRYLLFLLPVYLILVSRGITAIAGFFYLSKGSSSKDTVKKRHNAMILVVLLFALISLPLITGYYNSIQKNDWRVTSEYLQTVTQPGDAIVTLPGYMSQPLVYYYDNSSDETMLVSSSYTNDGLSDTVKNYNRVWFFVTWDISAANPDGSALQWLQNNATFVNQITGIYIFTYPTVT